MKDVSLAGKASPLGNQLCWELGVSPYFDELATTVLIHLIVVHKVAEEGTNYLFKLHSL